MRGIGGAAPRSARDRPEGDAGATCGECGRADVEGRLSCELEAERGGEGESREREANLAEPGGENFCQYRLRRGSRLSSSSRLVGIARAGWHPRVRVGMTKVGAIKAPSRVPAATERVRKPYPSQLEQGGRTSRRGVKYSPSLMSSRPAVQEPTPPRAGPSSLASE